MIRSAPTRGRVLFGIANAIVLSFAQAHAQPPLRTGVQQFIEEAPADVQIGPIVFQTHVVHRAVDGSWLKLKADSHWGSYSYLATRLSADPDESLSFPGTPAPPAGFVRSTETPWKKIQSSGPGASLLLEGMIVATKAEGREIEGRFNFKGEAVRLRLRLVEDNPLGADPTPALRNVYYGTDVRQKLDVYFANSAQPTPVAIFIHGGAWQRGDKTMLSGHRRMLAAGITVVAIDYRYIPSENLSASIPAVSVPLRDAARALQFVRSKATEWNLDKARIGVWGVSAGAYTSFWLATHAELAEPSSTDPVARESTRPLCAAGIFPQTSLDPVQMRAWVGPELAYGAHAFAIKATGGRSAFDVFVGDRDRLLPWIREYSVAELLSKDSAPLFLDYIDFDLTPNEPLQAYYTHSPQFGVGFQEQAGRVGAESHLRFVGHEDPKYSGWEQFLIARLTR